MLPKLVVEKREKVVYIIRGVPQTKGVVMNKKSKTKPDSDEQALCDLKSRAENGDPQAQFDFGMYYATANLPPTFTPTFETMRQTETCISMKKALEWWLKSAEQGHIRALQWVINCYKFGFGVCKDEKEMVKWIQKLVDQGDSNGLLQMGYCYACGSGVPMDESQAIKWWRKAAKKEQPSAEFNLGEAYITGYGRVKENKEKAIKWIKSAAEHGNKSAQEVYGKIEKWGFENVKKYLYPKIPFHTWQRHS